MLLCTGGGEREEFVGGSSSLQAERQPDALQSPNGIAKDGRSIDLSRVELSPSHCQRTPRSPANEPNPFPSAPSRVGRVGAVAAGLERRRQRKLLVRIFVTSHRSPATSMDRALASEPNPLPTTVSSVPPASEPNRGWIAVIRGGISASKGAPVAREGGAGRGRVGPSRADGSRSVRLRKADQSRRR